MVRGTLVTIGQLLGWEMIPHWHFFKVGTGHTLFLKNPRKLDIHDIRRFVNQAITPTEQSRPDIGKLLNYMYKHLN